MKIEGVSITTNWIRIHLLMQPDQAVIGTGSEGKSSQSTTNLTKVFFLTPLPQCLKKKQTKKI